MNNKRKQPISSDDASLSTKKRITTDASSVFGVEYLLFHILQFIQPGARSFVRLTCSLWNTTMRRLPNFSLCNIKEQGIYAAQYGHIECLRYLFARGLTGTTEAFAMAAVGGHFECLVLIGDQHTSHKDTAKAVTVGYLSRLEYAVDNRWNVCEEAATSGNVRCLEYAYNHALKHGLSVDMDYRIADCASRGSVACVEFVLKHGAEFSHFDMATAASTSLDILKFLRENTDGFWTASTCSNAAQHGRLDCLRYAHEQNCSWDENTCACAALGGNLDCLKYAHENGCPWYWSTCACAATAGSLACLKYAHENGCDWNSKTCSSAAAISLKCLKYAHENGCKWNRETCAQAAKNSQLDCLKYAHENGCKWDESTTELAARAGSISCLEYALTNGCPMSKNINANAAKSGNLECFQYARKTGGTWDLEVCKAAARGGSLDCFKYTLDNGLIPSNWQEICETACKGGFIDLLKFALPYAIENCNDIRDLVMSCKGAISFGHQRCTSRPQRVYSPPSDRCIGIQPNGHSECYILLNSYK